MYSRDVDTSRGEDWSIGSLGSRRVHGDDGCKETKESLSGRDESVTGTSRRGREELWSVPEEDTVWIWSAMVRKNSDAAMARAR